MGVPDPGPQCGLMIGDVYDGITGNSEKNAGTGVFGTRKNDSNSYQYAQSNDRVTTAKNNLDTSKDRSPESIRASTAARSAARRASWTR